MSSGINITDKTHAEISDLAHDKRISMKELAELMWTFIKEHEDEFTLEMF